MASSIKMRNALFLFKGHEILKTMNSNLFHKTKVRSKIKKPHSAHSCTHGLSVLKFLLSAAKTLKAIRSARLKQILTKCLFITEALPSIVQYRTALTLEGLGGNVTFMYNA